MCITFIFVFRSKFPSTPNVSGLSIPEWQMKQEPVVLDEKVITMTQGPDLVLNNNSIEPETDTPSTETPPSSEID